MKRQFSGALALAALLTAGVLVGTTQAYEVLWATNFNSSYQAQDDLGTTWTWSPDVSSSANNYPGKWFTATGTSAPQPVAQQFTENDPFGETGNLAAVLDYSGDDYYHRMQVMSTDFYKNFDLRGDPSDPNYEKFTVEAWARIDNVLQDSSNFFLQVLGITSDGAPFTTNVTLTQKFDVASYRCYLLGAGTTWQYTEQSWPTGEWHHSALTYDRAAGEMKYYMDGQLIVTQTEYFDWDGTMKPLDRPVPTVNELTELLVGRHWEGLIDDVRISRGIVPVNELGYFQSIPDPVTLLWDLNDDGVEDSQDIDYQLANPADLNGDGSVNLDDTLYLVGTGFGTLMGDTNLDGAVDEADLAWVADGWKIAGTYAWATGDFTGNDFIDEEDLAFLADNWKQPAPTAAAVPEPMTMSLIGLGGLALIRRR